MFDSLVGKGKRIFDVWLPVVAVFIAKIDNPFCGVVFIVIAKLIHQVGNHCFINFLWFVKELVDEAIAGFDNFGGEVKVALLTNGEQV